MKPWPSPVQFLDLREQYLAIREEVLEAVGEVFERTAFTNGYSVREFESAFAQYCGTGYAIALNSGTSAIHLALAALNIGRGDEVILPSATFIATAWGIAYMGAKPVFADCDPENWQIDPRLIEKHISPRTKAIIGVHLYGQPFDVNAIRDIAEKHGLFLIEDASQAHGSKYLGKMTGGWGDLGCFSHYPGKNLGTYGEGGCVTTDNPRWAEQISVMRVHHFGNNSLADGIGYNMRMGGVEGAVLRIKLKYLDAWNNRRREIATMYRTGITNPGIRFQKLVADSEPVYHLFVITTDNRERLKEYLRNHNVFPGIHYLVPCHLQPVFAHLGYRAGDLPHSEYLFNHCLTLPLYPELQDQVVNYIIDLLNSYS